MMNTTPPGGARRRSDDLPGRLRAAFPNHHDRPEEQGKLQFLLSMLNHARIAGPEGIDRASVHQQMPLAGFSRPPDEVLLHLCEQQLLRVTETRLFFVPASRVVRA